MSPSAIAFLSYITGVGILVLLSLDLRDRVESDTRAQRRITDVCGWVSVVTPMIVCTLGISSLAAKPIYFCLMEAPVCFYLCTRRRQQRKFDEGVRQEVDELLYRAVGHAETTTKLDDFLK